MSAADEIETTFDDAVPVQGEITPDLTLPKLLLRAAAKYGRHKVAMREKEFGVWRPITWGAYLENVKYLTLGLVALGLERGDKVAMIGDNRPEGLWAEMATLCAGGVGVWIFQDSLMDEVQYIIDHSDARFLVGEGQEEVDKGLSIQPGGADKVQAHGFGVPSSRRCGKKAKTALPGASIGSFSCARSGCP
jgi:long-subunit acyl-CoA synthetase (AMP-forming)